MDVQWEIKKPTALLILEDGSCIEGIGFGAVGEKIVEICFHTAFVGYQEILTDPSFIKQGIVFTFPHIGNTGITSEDSESLPLKKNQGAEAIILRTQPSSPSNYRAIQDLDSWLKERNIVGISHIDTRALTSLIRTKGAMNAAVVHSPEGIFNIARLKKEINDWKGLAGCDLALEASCENIATWNVSTVAHKHQKIEEKPHIIVVDYGVKSSILTILEKIGARITIVPAQTTAKEIKQLKPDGLVLSNGPGDPAATGKYAIPFVQEMLLDQSLPLFGICLGHQILALALGAKTKKMHQGHRGANHPVQEIETGRVFITSMNHGFTVVEESLPSHVKSTYISLFDGSNCGLKMKHQPVFSVQNHPESSPGPKDSFFLFEHFMDMVHQYRLHHKA